LDTSSNEEKFSVKNLIKYHIVWIKCIILQPLKQMAGPRSESSLANVVGIPGSYFLIHLDLSMSHHKDFSQSVSFNVIDPVLVLASNKVRNICKP
jgi:hypothetical protein